MDNHRHRHHHQQLGIIIIKATTKIHAKLLQQLLWYTYFPCLYCVLSLQYHLPCWEGFPYVLEFIFL